VKTTHLLQQTRGSGSEAQDQFAEDLGEGPAIEREIGDAAEAFGDSVETTTDELGSRPRL
ncbi:MAG: hypothetical protein M3440_15960, partial [Chloroflexota bacterium]|nr:hypothetical protein [Chloroflexota bacterium]